MSKYRLLYIDDDKVARMSFEKHMRENTAVCEYKIAESVAQAGKIMAAGGLDVILTDYKLEDGTGFDVLEAAKGVPVIFITGLGDEKVAVKALKSGAADYLIKDPDQRHWMMLITTVVRAVRRKKADDQLRLLSHSVKLIQECICISGTDGRIIFANDAFCKTYGYTEPQIIGNDRRTLWPASSPPPDAGGIPRGEYDHKRRDGTLFPVHYFRSVIFDERGRDVALVEVSHDLTEFRKAAPDLHRAISKPA